MLGHLSIKYTLVGHYEHCAWFVGFMLVVFNTFRCYLKLTGKEGM